MAYKSLYHMTLGYFSISSLLILSLLLAHSSYSDILAIPRVRPSILLPQSLCSICFLCLSFSFPRYSHSPLSGFIRVSVLMSPLQKAFTWPPNKIVSSIILYPALFYFTTVNLLYLYNILLVYLLLLSLTKMQVPRRQSCV